MKNITKLLCTAAVLLSLTVMSQAQTDSLNISLYDDCFAGVHIRKLNSDNTLDTLTQQERTNGIHMDESYVTLNVKANPQRQYGTNKYIFEDIPYNPPTGFTDGEKIVVPVDDGWSKIYGYRRLFPY